jgi:hypothetical protein
LLPGGWLIMLKGETRENNRKKKKLIKELTKRKKE